MKTIFSAFFIFASVAAYGGKSPNITCAAHNNTGYVVYNSDLQSIIGTSHYFERKNCEIAVSSLVKAGNKYLSCAGRGAGTGVYDVITGDAIGSDAYMYHDVNVCASALKHTYDGNFCVPYGEGSALYNIDLGFYSASYYYKDVAICNWASYSSTLSKKYICSAYGAGTAIFNKSDGKLAFSGVYSDIQDCIKVIKNI